jgi:hypothetical protein
MPRRKQTRFVIFAGPNQRAAPDRRYIAHDRSTTTLRTNAARFWTYWDAKAFAEMNQLALSGLTFIDREYFTDCEVQGRRTACRARTVRIVRHE